MLYVVRRYFLLNNQRSSKDFNFNNDDEFEGSGHNSELNQDLSQDLESSGSGLGSDDEDDLGAENPQVSYVPPVNNPLPPRKTAEVEIEQEPIDLGPAPGPTEDSSVIMNKKSEDRPTSFFAQPGILAAVIGGAVVGLLCAILVVMFIVYRMRKKDEGSYALGEPKQSPNSNSYSRGTNKEFFA
ncbi:hypothetical protein NQ314_020750 [Rhamnusium bicolor]|uniref:Syndecan n=1 Tax=Rhamnusium bicolor TaxID=1586634 RepID=A0AAV8WKP2_9CUCU|nr:hypothetical protein NQ314_020750 [Rhamnusium bicolor]